MSLPAAVRSRSVVLRYPSGKESNISISEALQMMRNEEVKYGGHVKDGRECVILREACNWVRKLGVSRASTHSAWEHTGYAGFEMVRC